ncbi:calcium-binding protein [Gemmobacter lanyuensis]
MSSPDRDYPDLYAADADPEDDRDYVFAGAGNDTIRTGDDADTIYGGGGTDLIQSGDDDDIVTANADNDTVEAGEGLTSSPAIWAMT